MHYKSHTIIRLPLHLPKQQPVYFTTGEHEAALEEARNQETMLTEFFKYNALHETPYTYLNFPIHFIFDQNRRRWHPQKQRGNSILGRMYSVSPRDTERYCLRLLLLHVPGPKSFLDLRTFEGQTAATYKEACIIRDLLTDDTEWDRCLSEAGAFHMPSQLRSLFATICLYCEPSDPPSLWLAHKDALCEDFVHVHGLNVQEAENKCLGEIQSIFQQSSFLCSDFGLPAVEIVAHRDCFDLHQEQQVVDENMALLNEEQRLLVDEILQALQEIDQAITTECRTYFLDGPGGTGKTMVYNTLIAICRCRGVKVAPCAWTGIAATLLTGGRTVHNLFKLPVPIIDTSVCNVSPTSKHAAFLKSITMFIIDEASMVPSLALNAIDLMLRDITGTEVPFGGKIFLLGGDFRQVLPVVPRSSRAVIFENCLKSSHLWSLFTVFKLTKNMRARGSELEFANWLLSLGNGELTSDPEYIHTDSIVVPSQCNLIDGDIVSAVFHDVSAPEALTHTVILTPTNQSSLALNEAVLQCLPGEVRVYYSTDTAVCDNDEEANNYPVEFLNSITPSGTIIMLLRNLDIQKGLCNGTRLIIRRLHSRSLDAEILTGTNKGGRVLIPRIALAPSDVSLPFTLHRVQFPVRLSYSMTINKSQGQTFERLGVYLPAPVFSHGQLYVAFSRGRSFTDLFVKIDTCTGQGITDGLQVYTQNVVFKEVL